MNSSQYKCFTRCGRGENWLTRRPQALDCNDWRGGSSCGIVCSPARVLNIKVNNFKQSSLDWTQSKRLSEAHVWVSVSSNSLSETRLRQTSPNIRVFSGLNESDLQTTNPSTLPRHWMRANWKGVNMTDYFNSTDFSIDLPLCSINVDISMYVHLTRIQPPCSEDKIFTCSIGRHKTQVVMTELKYQVISSHQIHCDTYMTDKCCNLPSWIQNQRSSPVVVLLICLQTDMYQPVTASIADRLISFVLAIEHTLEEYNSHHCENQVNTYCYNLICVSSIIDESHTRCRRHGNTIVVNMSMVHH